MTKGFSHEGYKQNCQKMEWGGFQLCPCGSFISPSSQGVFKCLHLRSFRLRPLVNFQKIFFMSQMSAPKNSLQYYGRMLRIFTWDGILCTFQKLGCRHVGYCRSERRLDGQTVVLTGGNAGIGLVTASYLWKKGADLVITCREESKGEAALKEIREKATVQDKTGSLRFVILDLSSFESVRNCAKHLLSTLSALHILINNAGVMMPPFGLTENGFELQFGTNHLGHFLFTLLLLPRILESAPARIVNVSSIAHSFYDEFQLDTMNDPERYYPLHAYFRSKAAMVMFSRELSKRLEGTGVNVYSLNPGYVSTGLYKYGDSALFPGFLFLKKYLLSWMAMKNPWEGAQTVIHCAICEKADQQTGLYYDECRPKEPNKLCTDDQLCQDLWRRSLDFVGLGQDYEIPARRIRQNQLSAISD